MLKSYNPADWYWTKEGGSIFSSAKIALVEPTDEQYVAWLAAGHFPTRWPADNSGAQSVAALQDVLGQYGLFADLKLYARDAFSKAVAGGTNVNVGTESAPVNVRASTDALSLSFLNTAVAVAKENPQATTPWVPETGMMISLNAEQVLKIDSEVQLFIQGQFATLGNLLTSIANGAVTERAHVDAAFAT